MLDKLPPWLRHLILLLFAWAIANGADILLGLHLSPVISGLAGIGFTMLVAFITPVMHQYGVSVDSTGTNVNVGAATIDGNPTSPPVVVPTV